MKRLLIPSLVFFAISLLVFLSLGSLQHKGLTFDETLHYSEARNIVNGKQVEGFNSTMLLPVLNTLVTHNGQDIVSRIKAGRLVTVFFTLLLAMIVYFWSMELYGSIPAVFSLFLVCLDPNIIAHGQLFTLDLYLSLMIILACYSYWRFLKYGGLRRALIAAGFLGISMLTKYTSFLLYPSFIAVAVLRTAPEIFFYLKRRDYSGFRQLASLFARYSLLFLFTSLLIINAGCFFQKTLLPLKEYSFRSSALSKIQSHQILSAIPIPLPYLYVKGIDLCKYADESGFGYGDAYLLGQVHPRGKDFHGFKGYFFIAMLFKVPIAILIFILLSLIIYVRKYWREILKREELVILVPVVIALVYFNYFMNIDYGIRHILFIFPLLYVFCGSLFVPWKNFSWILKAGFISLLIYLAVSVFSYFPHYISYFNEFVGDRKQSYKLLADSNLDWGGNDWFLARYLKEHPGVRTNPIGIQDGTFVIDADKIAGVWKNEGLYRWLRENFEPIDHVAYSFLVYNITPADKERLLKSGKCSNK